MHKKIDTTTKIAIFRRQEIRKTIHNNEWWFSIIDIIEALAGSERPRKYWNDLKKKLTDEGYYEVPAVSLTGQCQAYDPEFILLWLPNEQIFGTWDCDHWDLYVFRDRTWPDIVADPATYLDSSWNDYQRKNSEYYKPYPEYEFKEGMPF